jgi:DNA-binding response OmpR family regulator
VIGEPVEVVKQQTTILLLCSDSNLRLVMQEVLENKGYVVLPASDLSRAVDWLSRCKPDLLLVRPYLSGISGYEAALYLRTKCHGIRIMMVSGYLQDNRLQYQWSLQGIEVFPKPFTGEEFLEKVANVLTAPNPAPRDAPAANGAVSPH